MHGILRRLPLVALAITLLGGTLAPAMAQAAPPPRAATKIVQRASLPECLVAANGSRVQLSGGALNSATARSRVVWLAPNPVTCKVTAGAYHERFILARFYTSTQIKPIYFTVRFNGGLYARSATQYLGTVGRGAHGLDFVTVVPARTRAGLYKGVGRLLRRTGKRDYDQVGGNFYVFVRVVRAPRPIAPAVHWQPANSLGAIAVQRGQTVTENVSFTSNVALTRARVAVDLGAYARDHGVRVRVVSPLAPQNVALGAAVPVVFTVSAGRAARLGVYPADLHVDAAAAGRRYARLPYDLDFRVVVRRIAPVIHWQPANNLGTIAVQRGQTVTETASFTSSVALTDVRLAGKFDYPDRAEDSRVGVRVVSPTALPSLAANTPVSVTFTIRAGYRAPLGGYNAGIHVIGTEPGGPRAVLPYDLDVRVAVRRDVAVVQWQPSDNLGAIRVQQGQTVTETASFTSSVDLTNVDIRRALGEDAIERGVRVTVVSPATLPGVAANTPVSVTFTLSARAGTPVGAYPAYLYVVGTEPGGPRAILHYGLHFAVRVIHVAPAIQWQPSDNLGGITVQRGQTVTETASFTSSVDLTNVDIRRALGEDAIERGVGVAVVSPVGPQSVAANTPVSVTFTLTARPAARVGNYPAYLYVVGTEPGGPRAILHYGLHFVVRVRHIAPVIQWQPSDSLGAITLQRGQTVTETVSFSSNVALTSAEVRSVFNDTAQDRGVAITIRAPSTFPAIDAGAVVPVTFTITAKPGARLGGYADALYVKASEPGAAPVRLPYSLRYTIDVDRAPATTVAWAGGNYVTFPAIARGQIVTETATFTTSADVTNAVIRLSGVQRSPGLRIRLIPLGATPETPVSIAANTPTTVSIVVDATKMAVAGFFTGDVFLHAQPANAPARQLLHYGLHFTGAVQ